MWLLLPQQNEHPTQHSTSDARSCAGDAIRIHFHAWCVLALALGLLFYFVVGPRIYWVVSGLAHGEHFYRGWPSSYWGREIDDWIYRGWPSSYRGSERGD